MFRFLVDEHAAKKKGSLLHGDWTLEFADEAVCPQQTDGWSCSLSTFMVADCLSLDLKLDYNNDHFGCCREQMVLKILEREDGKQFKPCSCTDNQSSEEEDDNQSSEEEGNQSVHLESFEDFHIQLVQWCTTHHIVRAAGGHMIDGRSYIKMHPCIKPNNEKEGRGVTASQAIDNLDDDETVVGESKALKEVKNDDEVVCLGVRSPKASKQNEATDRQGQGQGQGQGNAAASTASKQINTDQSMDVDGDTEYFHQKRLIDIADIQSISNKGFCICGEFSSESEHSNHIASLTVVFNSQCAPVQVVNRCEKHLSETTNEDCPCRCVVQIHNHFLKMKVPNWPGSESDFYYLYPVAYQQRKTIEYYQFMERSSQQLLLVAPTMNHRLTPSDDSDESSSILDAAPKYKDKISGRRFRSKGEINSSARKPMHKREGGRLSKSASAVAQVNPSKNLILSMNSNDNVLYETRNFAYSGGDTKSTESEIVSLIDMKASGCVFVCGPEFVVESTTDARQLTATVAGASLGPQINVPLKTMAFLAKTVEGQSVICLFHNSAHIEDTSRNLFILSLTQMQSAGVKINVDWNNKNATESPETLEKDCYSFKIKRGPQIFRYDKRSTPFIDLRPFPKEHYQQMEKVDMTSRDVWMPPPKLQSKKQCSICGATDCRRPRCPKLHSFGLGVVAPRDLQPGKYFVYKMMNKMSDIVNNQDTVHPLELHAKSDDDLDELLPLASPTDDEYHLNLGRNHNNNRKNALRLMEQLDMESTTPTSDFLSLFEGQERDAYHGTSPTNSRSFQSIVLTKVQEIMLRKAKVTVKTIEKVKQGLSGDALMLLSQDSELISEELSQANLLSQSAFKDALLDSPNQYSQESVNMMNNYEDELFHCNQILEHDGPLKPGCEGYQGCKYKIKAKWANGDVTWEPLNTFVGDNPNLVAEYIVRNNLDNLLTEKRLWGRKAVKEKIDEIRKNRESSTGEKTNRYTGKKMKKQTRMKKPTKASTRPKRTLTRPKRWKPNI